MGLKKENSKSEFRNPKQIRNTNFKISKRPRRSLGQNFLIDPNYRRKIIAAIRKDYEGETVIEIGPGRGALTEGLALFAKELVLIEKDALLAGELRKRFHACGNVRVINEDFLKVDLEGVTATRIGVAKKPLVIGNLPYNVASQILIRLLRHNERYKRLYLMFQKEVAQRCLAAPGTRQYGILTVWTRLFSEPKKLFDLPPTAFRPRPKVTSRFVRFDLLGRAYEAEAGFIEFVRVLFQQRRKMIKSRVTGKETAAAAWSKRPEGLTLPDLKLVYRFLKEKNLVLN